MRRLFFLNLTQRIAHKSRACLDREIAAADGLNEHVGYLTTPTLAYTACVRCAGDVEIERIAADA